MAIKRQELIDGCFAKAADDEPLFVLRAKDMLAPALVRAWAIQFDRYHRANTGGTSPELDKKYREAMDLADTMEQWPNRKMPD